jgi:cyclase
MKKKRIIPVVLYKDGFVVQSKKFSEYRNLGNPFDSIRRLSEWGADEVSFIDIGLQDGIVQYREDLGRKSPPSYLEVLEEVSLTASMPLSSGGQIRTIDAIRDRLKKGSDKVMINTSAVNDLDFLKKSIQIFGSQCITASIDVKRIDETYTVFVNNGQTAAVRGLNQIIDTFNTLQVGELFLNSIDRDGTKTGFDLELCQMVAKRVDIPLVVCGGAGKWEDFENVLQIDGVDGVAAANIFQHTDQSVFLAHKYLYDRGLNVRRPQLLR